MSKVSEQKRQETLEKVIKTATEIFSKRGYHNTQVMDVVRAAGISAGTFYNYFKDKRDLYEQITRENFNILRSYIRSIRSKLNIWDRNEQRVILHQTFNAFFNYTEQNPELVYIVLRGGFGVDEKFDTITWASLSAFADDLAEDIQNWLDEGIIESINPYLFGHAIVGMVMQVFHSYLVEKRFTREEALEYMSRSSLASFDLYLTDKGRQRMRQVK
jgi:AcrR family transcriptional regulator